MLAVFPCIQCYGQPQYHTILDQTASENGLHMQTEGRCFARSNVHTTRAAEIRSASCKFKDNYETHRHGS
jgi:hypothetical protein